MEKVGNKKGLRVLKLSQWQRGLKLNSLAPQRERKSGNKQDMGKETRQALTSCRSAGLWHHTTPKATKQPLPRAPLSQFYGRAVAVTALSPQGWLFCLSPPSLLPTPSRGGESPEATERFPTTPSQPHGAAGSTPKSSPRRSSCWSTRCEAAWTRSPGAYRTGRAHELLRTQNRSSAGTQREKKHKFTHKFTQRGEKAQMNEHLGRQKAARTAQLPATFTESAPAFHITK